MPSQSTSGTQTATVTTEHVLATITTAGVYELAVDTNAMVNGDELELKITDRVLTGGTNRTCYFASFAHVQATNTKKSPPIVVLFNATFTLKQTAGTSRDFPWGVNRIDT